MEDFFAKKQNENVEQWRPSFQLRLVNLSADLKQHAEHHCNQIEKAEKPYSNMIKTKQDMRSWLERECLIT